MKRLMMLLVAAGLVFGCAAYQKLDEWNRTHGFLDEEDRATLRDIRDQRERQRTKGAVVYGPNGEVWRVIH